MKKRSRDGLAARRLRLYLRGGGVSTARGTGSMIRLTLYGRVDCHLCHEMLAVVEAVVREPPLAGRVVVEEVDVDGDPALIAAYGAEVPVLCLDGREIFRHRVGAAALRDRLLGKPVL